MSRLADILSGMDRGRARPRGLGGIADLTAPQAPRRKWRIRWPLVILAIMAVIAMAAYLRPQPGAGRQPSVTAPLAVAPVVSQQPVGPAAPPRAPAPRETDERVRALMRSGTEAAERGAFGEAAGFLRQATALAPGDPGAWNALGVVLVRLGDLTAGVEAFRRAVRLKPAHAEAERNLGVALDRQGKPDEAAVRYRAFLNLTAEGDPARSAVQRRLAEIASRKGEQ